MTRLEDRQTLVREIEQAQTGGARQAKACALAGLDPRTVQRWRKNVGLTQGDRRPDAIRPTPAHALTEEERAKIVAVANEPRFADTPPARIVPALADEGVYIASESSFHRVLREHGQMKHRGRAHPPRTSRPPTTHIATQPGEVWCWDMTFLPASVQGQWFYFYMILDIYSRKIVGFEVHPNDSSDHTAQLAKRTALAERLHGTAAKPVLHGDNGATLKATTVLAMLNWLGIKPSYSRPRVSDDNPYAEALFRTAKYRPEFPAKGFADLDTARNWAMRFVCWYNHDHRHSGIRYVSPAQRHAGEDRGLLAGRHELYLRARGANPRRWSGETRDWTPVGAVTLNPEKDTVVQAAIAAKKLSGSIGEPAFPSRPGEPEAMARSEGEERSGATRSHAQRALQREHGEAGEHRTFPEASTMAHSAPAGGPGHRPRGDIQGKEAR
jgi:transposase InsO family protein